MFQVRVVIHNVLHREIPFGTFETLSNLKILNLHGNKINLLTPEMFHGLEISLEYLDMGFNIIDAVQG